MDRLIDVTAADGGVLDRTESDGVLGRSLLCLPLSTRLRDVESVRYVAWNKKRGVTCIHGGPETYTPDGSYRAFAVVTNTRLLFVVGGDAGDDDRIFSLPYTDVLTVETTAHFLSSTLELVAEGEQRWQFACRVDLDPVADYVDEAVQCWTRAETLFDRADDRVSEAHDAVEDGRLEAATEALDTAETHLDGARAHLEELGQGALARGTAAEDIERDIADARGRLAAARGARAHETARDAWDDGEYATAYDAYERAREAYRRARSLGVSDLPVEERLATVDGECEQLSRAPIERAEEAADAARGADDERTAIEHWETALERYRTALELDWGRDRRFDGDTEQLRTAVADAATAIVDARRDVARDRLEVSDWLRESGDLEGARAALGDARGHFERAHEVAAELVPDRRDHTTDDMAAVAERVARLDAESSLSDTEL